MSEIPSPLKYKALVKVIEEFDVPWIKKLFDSIVSTENITKEQLENNIFAIIERKDQPKVKLAIEIITTDNPDRIKVLLNLYKTLYWVEAEDEPEENINEEQDIQDLVEFLLYGTIREDNGDSSLMGE